MHKDIKGQTLQKTDVKQPVQTGKVARADRRAKTSCTAACSTTAKSTETGRTGPGKRGKL